MRPVTLMEEEDLIYFNEVQVIKFVLHEVNYSFILFGCSDITFNSFRVQMNSKNKNKELIVKLIL